MSEDYDSSQKPLIYHKPAIQKHDRLSQVTFSAHTEGSTPAIPKRKDKPPMNQEQQNKRNLLDNLFALGERDGLQPEEIAKEILKNPPPELRRRDK